MPFLPYAHSPGDPSLDPGFLMIARRDNNSIQSTLAESFAGLLVPLTGVRCGQ